MNLFKMSRNFTMHNTQHLFKMHNTQLFTIPECSDDVSKNLWQLFLESLYTSSKWEVLLGFPFHRAFEFLISYKEEGKKYFNKIGKRYEDVVNVERCYSKNYNVRFLNTQLKNRLGTERLLFFHKNEGAWLPSVLRPAGNSSTGLFGMLLPSFFD